MSPRHYVLRDRKVVSVDLMEWADWVEFHNQEKIVKQETIGPYWVSTVFLGLDHNWSRTGPPILWETLVFGKGPLKDEMDRSRRILADAMALAERITAEG